MANVYPTILAGQRITTALLESMLPVTAIKTASTSRASTTTVSADPELQFSVVAGAEYVFYGYIRYSGVDTSDIDVQFTAPTGATGSWSGNMLINGQIDGGTHSGIRVAFNAERTWATPSTSAAQTCLIRGRLTMGGTAGTFSMDWAQNISGATATVVEADSWIRLDRVA